MNAVKTVLVIGGVSLVAYVGYMAFKSYENSQRRLTVFRNASEMLNERNLPMNVSLTPRTYTPEEMAQRRAAQAANAASDMNMMSVSV